MEVDVFFPKEEREDQDSIDDSYYGETKGEHDIYDSRRYFINVNRIPKKYLDRLHYQVVSGTVDARNGGTLYGGKAFVISISQNCKSSQVNAGGTYTYNCYHHGTYLNGGTIENKSAYQWYGTTGVLGNIKKFASSVTAGHFDHNNGGGSKGTGYAAIFKI